MAVKQFTGAELMENKMVPTVLGLATCVRQSISQYSNCRFVVH